MCVCVCEFEQYTFIASVKPTHYQYIITNGLPLRETGTGQCLERKQLKQRGLLWLFKPILQLQPVMSLSVLLITERVNVFN